MRRLNKKAHVRSPCNFSTKNRRGQFYLIAALAIVSLAAGLIIVTNKVSTTNNPGFKYLQNEIETEGSNIISYGVYNGLNDSQIQGMLKNLSLNYINNSAQSNLYFLFGTKSNQTLIAYQTSNADVYVNEYHITIIGTGDVYSQNFLNPGNPISIKINNNNYTFSLNEGENFHFVVDSLTGGQNYVTTG